MALVGAGYNPMSSSSHSCLATASFYLKKPKIIMPNNKFQIIIEFITYQTIYCMWLNSYLTLSYVLASFNCNSDSPHYLFLSTIVEVHPVTGLAETWKLSEHDLTLRRDNILEYTVDSSYSFDSRHLNDLGIDLESKLKILTSSFLSLMISSFKS